MTFGSFRGTSAPQKLIENNEFSCVFLRFGSIQSATRSSLLFSKMLRKPRVFTRFSDRGGYGSVPAFSLFSLARFSKTASETNFEHFSSHAWPKKIDFVASETIRRHFPSLIEPCMVRMYSFRGFWNSFWTFPMADPEAHFWHFLVSGSRMLIEWPKAYFRHFPALSLPRKYPLLDSQN